MSKAVLGTIIHATMRSCDLVPEFLSEYCRLEPIEENAAFCRMDLTSDEIDSINAADSWEDVDPDLLDAMCEQLFDLLDAHAPPYCYFGSHPGDGSDYGFWPSEEFLADPNGQGVACIDDYAETEDELRKMIPEHQRKYVDGFGEYLHVNDHGNATLYAFDGKRFSEVWSIV